MSGQVEVLVIRVVGPERAHDDVKVIHLLIDITDHGHKLAVVVRISPCDSELLPDSPCRLLDLAPIASSQVEPVCLPPPLRSKSDA